MRKTLTDLFECQMTICWNEFKLNSYELMIANGYKPTDKQINTVISCFKRLISEDKARCSCISKSLPKHVTQIMRALAFIEAKVIYKNVKPLIDWFFILFFSLLLQARVLTTPPTDNQSNAPPLALGYDINTPPTAPPISI